MSVSVRAAVNPLLGLAIIQMALLTLALGLLEGQRRLFVGRLCIVLRWVGEGPPDIRYQWTSRSSLRSDVKRMVQRPSFVQTPAYAHTGARFPSRFRNQGEHAFLQGQVEVDLPRSLMQLTSKHWRSAIHEIHSL